MPVGARDMSGNACDMRMPEMPMSDAGSGCLIQNQYLTISASEIYRGLYRVNHQIFPRLRLRPFQRSCSSLGTKESTRPGEGGRARRNLEGQCCDFTQINSKGGSYRGLEMRRGQLYERVRMP